ncbi:helix-turn-helix domain-containing protein [Providencia stuartii]|uniref:helix-turn-helix domain-containing protein n=1 Tax=Providencia stuartii TaxID=588 RepID=UPI00331B0E3A
MTQSSRSMFQWNNPESPLGLTGFKVRLQTLIGKNSIRSFASECGISDATLRKYLSGQSLPGIDKVEAIVKYTGCSLEWLVTGKGTQQPLPPNNITPKEIEAGWNYIFQSLTLDEKYRVISTFNRGGLQALFAEQIFNT